MARSGVGVARGCCLAGTGRISRRMGERGGIHASHGFVDIEDPWGLNGLGLRQSRPDKTPARETGPRTMDATLPALLTPPCV